MIAISSRKQIRNTMYLESQLLLGKKILILLCPFYYENCFFLTVFWILFKILFFFPSYFNSSSITIAFFDSHPPLHPHFWFHFLMYPFLLTSLMSDFYPQNLFKTDFLKNQHLQWLSHTFIQSLFVSYCCCSVTKSCTTLCHPMNCSMPGFPVHHQPLELAQTHVHQVVDATQPSHPLSSSSPPPSIFPSIRVFSSESVLHIRWPKFWGFSFNISPSNEYSGLISFRMDWLDLLTVQGTVKSSPTQRFKTLSSSVPSFLYGPTLTSIMTSGKTTALTTQTFSSKVISLLLNILSKFVISFLPRSKCLLFHGSSHWLQWFWSPRK